MTHGNEHFQAKLMGQKGVQAEAPLAPGQMECERGRKGGEAKRLVVLVFFFFSLHFCLLAYFVLFSLVGGPGGEWNWGTRYEALKEINKKKKQKIIL